jgi:hypothetical protein
MVDEKPLKGFFEEQFSLGKSLHNQIGSYKNVSFCTFLRKKSCIETLDIDHNSY